MIVLMSSRSSAESIRFAMLRERWLGEGVRGVEVRPCTAHNLLKLAQGRSLSALTPMPQKAELAAA